MDFLVVTIPESEPLSIIELELNEINTVEGTVGNHRLGSKRPAQLPNYIQFVYRGEIRWQALLIGYEFKEFECTTTGKNWNTAWYAVFVDVEELNPRIPYQGFRGFRYR